MMDWLDKLITHRVIILFIITNTMFMTIYAQDHNIFGVILNALVITLWVVFLFRNYETKDKE